MRPWWGVRSGDPSSASHSTHTFTSVRCRDRGGGIHIHVAVVRRRIARVQFHEDSTTEVELVIQTRPMGPEHGGGADDAANEGAQGKLRICMDAKVNPS